MMLDVAHLIDRKGVERYLNKFSATCAVMREYQMQLSGPWPPYHFVHRLTCGTHSHSQQPASCSHPGNCASAGGKYAGAGCRPGLKRLLHC